MGAFLDKIRPELDKKVDKEMLDILNVLTWHAEGLEVSTSQEDQWRTHNRQRMTSDDQTV